MSRTFAYLRVSTLDQENDNQLLEIRNKGYDIPDHRVVSDIVSGSVQASKRQQFQHLLNKLESGDTLVVLKLDRLGRDNIDVQQTISLLIERGIKPICLDLPVRDLSTPEGKLMLQLFSTFAEFERNRIIERTQEGLKRAKAQGKQLGRPEATDTTDKVQKVKAAGLTQSQAASTLKLSLPTIKRHWNKQV